MKLLALMALSVLLDVSGTTMPVYEHDFFTYALTIEDANPKDIDFALNDFPNWVNLEAAQKTGIIYNGKNAVKIILTFSAQKSGTMKNAKILITHNNIETKIIELPGITILQNPATAVPEVFLNIHSEAPYYAGEEYIFEIMLSGAKEITEIRYDLSEDFLLERLPPEQIQSNVPAFKWTALKSGNLHFPNFNVTVKTLTDTQTTLLLTNEIPVFVNGQSEKDKNPKTVVKPEENLAEKTQALSWQNETAPGKNIFFTIMLCIILIIFLFFGIYFVHRKKIKTSIIFISFFAIILSSIFFLNFQVPHTLHNKKVFFLTHNAFLYRVPNEKSNKTEINPDAERIELLIKHDAGAWIYVSERGKKDENTLSGWLLKQDL